MDRKECRILWANFVICEGVHVPSAAVRLEIMVSLTKQ